MTYNATNSTHVEFELSGKGDWIAVGFSDDQSMVGCLTGPTACHTQGPGELTMIYTGNLRPKVKRLNTLVYTILDRKGTPFLNHLLTNGIPYTYLVSYLV